MQLYAHFRLAFASAPQLNCLTSLHNITRRPVLQKVRYHTIVVLYLLVSIGFQVLFHSPPGVLFTFPSRYYTLSVTRSYLALGDGPPFFPPDSSCPVVLRIPPASSIFQLQDCYFLWSSFPAVFVYIDSVPSEVHNPAIYHYTTVWALSLSLTTTQKIDFSFSSSGYLDVSVPRVPLHILCVHIWILSLQQQ